MHNYLKFSILTTIMFIACTNLAIAQGGAVAPALGPCVGITFSSQKGELVVNNGCSYTLDAFYQFSGQVPVTEFFNGVLRVNGLGTHQVSFPVGFTVEAPSSLSVEECPPGFAIEASDPVSCIPFASPFVAAALPSAFATQTGHAATIFATVLSTSNQNLSNCRVGLMVGPGDINFINFSFQQTNAANNSTIAPPNAAVELPAGGSVNYVLSFESSTPFQEQNLPLIYSCDNVVSLPGIPGVGDVDVDFSSSPIANIVAEEATASGNATVSMPVGGTGAFAISTSNVGASSSITVSSDTNGVSLPLTVTICQSNAQAQCLTPPSPTVNLMINSNATPTFSVFLDAHGSIPFSPGLNRVFVRFKDGSGAEVGATSVAVEAN